MSTQNRKDAGGIGVKAIRRHFEARRLPLGMRPGEFPVFAGSSYPNSKYGGSLRALELHGKPCLRTIVRVAAALGIDDDSVRAIGGLDLAKHPEARAGRLDRAATGAWAKAELPAHLRCLRRSRMHARYLRPDGTSYEVPSAFGDADPGPIMRFK